MRPCPPRIRDFDALNIVCDGSSLTQGIGSSPGKSYPEVLATLAPLVGTDATVTNVGIGGQTWRMMAGLDGGSFADIDSAFVVGKRNVLIAWETTNSITGGRTVAQAIGDMEGYLAACLPEWEVVLVTSLPRQYGASDPRHDSLMEVDTYCRSNYRRLGVTALVDVRRAGGPFAFDGKSDADFARTQHLWYETENRIHLRDAGYAVIAGWMAAQIRQLGK